MFEVVYFEFELYGLGQRSVKRAAAKPVVVRRARSWRIGWTRMTLPSTDSGTDAPTIATSMLVRAHSRLARQLAPAKLIPPASAMRVAVKPVVAVSSASRRAGALAPALDCISIGGGGWI